MTFHLLSDLYKEKSAKFQRLRKSYEYENIKVEVLNNDIYDYKDENEKKILWNKLNDIAIIFQTQLPKMPKEYIFRQVFDPKHYTLAIIEEDGLFKAGVCYRPFYQRNFVEIVFCAVENDSQIKGYGSYMMDLLKEHVKNECYYNLELSENNSKEKTSIDKFKQTVGLNTKIKHFTTQEYLAGSYKPQKKSIHLVTYADNFAIGYFKKNGFTTENKFQSWIGYIKDYDGGTIVQSKIYWEINYLKKDQFINILKENLIKKISQKSEFAVVRDPIDVKSYQKFEDIPGISQAKLQSSMLERKSRSESIKNILKHFTSELQSNSNSWPFLKPVNEVEVPDYYKIIKNPMDLSMIEKKVEEGAYSSFFDFQTDFKLIISNCTLYNNPLTQYYKCGQNLDDYFDEKAKFFNFISKDDE